MEEEKYVIANSKGWEWECPYCTFINESEYICSGAPHKCESCGKETIVEI